MQKTAFLNSFSSFLAVRRKRNTMARSGRSAARTRNPPPNPHLSALPEILKACTSGWLESSDPKKPFELLSEDEFFEKYLNDRMLESYLHIAKSMKDRLASWPLEVNTINALYQLLDNVIVTKLAELTSQQLAKRNLSRVSPLEFKRFLAMKYLRSRFNVSTDVFFDYILPGFAASHKFAPFEKERFKNLLMSL